MLRHAKSVEQFRESILAGSVIVDSATAPRDVFCPLSPYYELFVGGAEKICLVAREAVGKTLETCGPKHCKQLRPRTTLSYLPTALFATLAP